MKFEIPKAARKRYFPFSLGNGIDCVLIDYSGSMACNSGHLHLEQHQGTICAWYKSTHRNRGQSIVPLVQADFTLFHGEGEACEIGAFDQNFDPETAVLSTRIQAAYFQIEIKTFLTSEQILVEHYTLSRITENNPVIALNLHPPFPPSSFTGYSAISSYNFYPTTEKCAVGCDYQVNGIKGAGIMYTDFPTAKKDIFPEKARILLSGFNERNSFTKYLVLLDEKDTCDFKKMLNEKLDGIKSWGYENILQSHQQDWKKYYRQSSVSLPDKELEHLYQLSLYLIRAQQNLQTGLISLGNYPILWNGGVSNPFDLFFSHRALLGANRLKEAEKLIEGYKKVIPLARDYARRLGCKGAYFPWFMNCKGESLDFIDPKECPMIEKYNNGCLVMEAWNQYLYSGDINTLKKYWSLIKETTDFLLSAIVSENEQTACIRRGEGADESAPRKNDTSHLLTTIKSLEALIQAAAVLDEKISESYRSTLNKLKLGLKGNYRKKILLPYAGSDMIKTSTFTFFLFNLPEGTGKENITAALKACKGRFGLTSPGNYQNLIWPWAEWQAAIALSYLKDKRAFKHLYNGTRYSSSSGAFPEKIRPDGFAINYWYLTAHGSYVWAVNSMLAHSVNNKIAILPGIPGTWKDLAFENLRLAAGILVSLKMENGKICDLRLKNINSRAVEIILEIPPRFLNENISTTNTAVIDSQQSISLIKQ
ncbi:MAG: hypothetical protein PHV82_10825 [Victivallaceae bacterium]|nr:hypothetical protein [Victivallaceae bacterium]